MILQAASSAECHTRRAVVTDFTLPSSKKLKNQKTYAVVNGQPLSESTLQVLNVRAQLDNR